MQTNNVNTDKYGIRFTGGTTLPQRLATLTHDGPRLVNKGNWLASAGKALLPTPDAQDDVEISLVLHPRRCAVRRLDQDDRPAAAKYELHCYSGGSIRHVGRSGCGGVIVGPGDLLLRRGNGMNGGDRESRVYFALSVTIHS